MHRNPPPSEAPVDASQMSMAMAAARQRVMDAHFEFLLELVHKTRGQVPAPRSLAIYARLHRLGEFDVQALRHRILVHLGELQSVAVTDLPNTFVAIDGEVEWDVTASLVERIRKRLTGRKLHDLREWVALHSGHVETELLKLHVDNVVAVADSAPSQSREDIVRAYGRELGLGDRINEMLYHGLLAVLFARQATGEAGGAAAAGAESDAEPSSTTLAPSRRKGPRILAGPGRRRA